MRLQKMKDALAQYAKIKRQLVEERENVTKRLAEINAVLGGNERVPAKVKQGPRTVGRGTGKLTMAQAVLDAFGSDGGEKGNGKTIAELMAIVRATAGKTHKVTRPIVSLGCINLTNKGQLKKLRPGIYALA
jgi:hypothetical protein